MLSILFANILSVNMMTLIKVLIIFNFVLTITSIRVDAQLVINEIHYSSKDLSGVEDTTKEWIEVFNASENSLSLNGWRITSGVDFEFPDVVIDPKSFIVVASDPAKFSQLYPDGPNALGPWRGKLSNTGETIRLRDPSGKEIDQVDYADEGFWATRKRGPEDLGHEGWIWFASHDGEGNTLELINWADKNNNGQNWNSSSLIGGTPGKQNSIFNPNFIPLVKSVSHDPLIPKSTDSVVVKLDIDNKKRFDDLQPKIFWRVNGGGDNFNSSPMDLDDDGLYFSNIPEQNDNAVIEFFFVIEVEGQESTVWPPSIDGQGNVCNYLYMVDDSFSKNDSIPSYYVVMTDSERSELEEIGSRSSQADSNAEMNCTFISFDGKGDRVRYLASIRNRGASSRRGPPNNQLIKFRSDDPWNGQESIKFNCQYIHSQVAGSWLYQWLGVKAADSIPVKLRINGEDLAESGGPRMYGHYARTESLDSNFVSAHWPDDPNGNLYQVRDDEDSGDEGDLKFEGDEADNYRNTYFKKTNRSVDDWNDIINLTRVLNDSDSPDFVGKISEVIDIDQWLHFLAVDSLVGNREGGLTTGKGDDYALYRGEKDQRFQLVPHDLDTVLDQGSRSGDPNLSIFTYRNVDGLEELLSHPDIIRMYYEKFIDILENKYKPELINPIIDRALTEIIPTRVINEMKEYIVDRRRGVLAQIKTDYSVNVDLNESNDGFFRTTNGEAKLTGDFHVGKVKSIKVNGTQAVINPRTGDWELNLRSFDDGGLLTPGVNRLRVTFHGESDDELLHEEYIKLWNDTGKVTEVSGVLRGNDFSGNIFLTTRSSYIPKVPFLVRVDLRDKNGKYIREIWDETATLSSDTPGIRITPNVVNLRNGLGSALVNVEGGGEEEIVELISEGSEWAYLDDGSDQGVIWKGRDFNDTEWEKGRGELGYGDGDEVTELSFGTSSRNKYATTYFRSEFNLDEIEEIAALEMRLKYDDGAIVYINGEEFFKTSNMEYGMAYDDYTIDGDDTPSENFQNFSKLPAKSLVVGRNVIAVEIKQGDNRSSDISFDLGLRAIKIGPSVDPGDINLNVRIGQSQISKSITSLGADTTPTILSGVLRDQVINWSGIVRIVGDVTVPKGSELNIAPGTVVLLDGDAEPQSDEGADLIIAGSINCSGTDDNPITFTSSLSGNTWGQILFDESESAVFKYTNIHQAGHSPKGGHTDHGRVLRVLGSNVLFEDCTISDNRGKIGQSDSRNGKGCNLIFRRCHWARSVMGFEAFDSGMLVEDSFITDMLGIYREDDVTDDNDAIYLHESNSDQNLILKNLTVAYMDDDGIDTLDAKISASGIISRNCADKGISVLGGEFQLDEALLVNNSIGISAKDDADVSLKNITISGNTIVGIQVENKNGDDEPSRYSVSNSIFWGNQESIATDYDDDDIAIADSIIEGGWQDNINEDPLFRDPGSGDFRISDKSPAIKQDIDDLVNRDLGFYDYRPVGGEVVWGLTGSPYHVTDDVKIPNGVVFKVEPGVSIYVNEGLKIEVEGTALVEGDLNRRIYFSHLPGSQFVNDDAGNGGLPDAPPKWKGLKLLNTLDEDNIIKHADFDSAQDEEGAIGVLNSQCIIDDVSFNRTHIRMIYTEDASVIIRNTKFPDMFSESEGPAELGLDNISEHIKGIGEIPSGGRYIIRDNFFGSNKGHNDVIDVDSGWRPNPILQIIGNYFSGTGDELCDLGGDVFLSENIFLNVFKDDETSDRGYANAISTGDVGPDATFSISRNIFADVDHAISLKIQSSTIFENNTVYKIHPDFNDRFDNPSVASVVNLFIPTDTDSRATHGKGAYLSDNILVTPRVFSGADDAKNPPYPVTPLELNRNLLDPRLSDIEIGRNHQGLDIFDLGEGNTIDDPMFVNPDANDFRLQSSSPAKGSGKFGQDLGAIIPAGIFISGEPNPMTTSSSAKLNVGGPGYFAYQWRFKGGAWSEIINIGDGFKPEGNTIRAGEIILKDLKTGTHLIEVIGQDFAGNWQEVPTQSHEWEVVSELPDKLILNEILIFNDGVFDSEGISPSYVEIKNLSTRPMGLEGLYLVHNSNNESRINLSGLGPIEGEGYMVVNIDSILSSKPFDNGAGSIDLLSEGNVIDSVNFGFQASNYSIGRHGRELKWELNYPTPGEVNRIVGKGRISDVRINEWLANTNTLNEEEFVELFNPSKFPIDLAGGQLSDSIDPGDNAMVFSQLSFIGPDSYLAVEPKGFGLSTDFDQILLLDSFNQTIDEVVYGPQNSGVSEGIIKGENSYEKFLLPTPGVDHPSIGTNDYELYQKSVDLINNLRITEIMYNPIGGSDYEFIELSNLGDTTLSLNGVSFSEGIEFVFDDLDLLPNDSIVIVSNLEAFISRYGNVTDLIYQYEGKLNNAGERIVIQLPDPFPFKIINFSFQDQWFEETDGRGYSLVLNNREAEQIDYGSRESWTLGSYLGSPNGRSIHESYADWSANHDNQGPLVDHDGDGLINGFEYVLGEDSKAVNQIMSPQYDREKNMFYWDISRRLVANDYSVILESSDNLVNWERLSVFESTIGPLSEMVRIVQPSNLIKEFYRLRLDKKVP